MESTAMSSHSTSKIFVIGGTGAQGIPVINALVADKKYSVRFLTRDPASRRATDLLALDNVSVLEGSFADEAILREGFRGCDGAFINIDGFNTGERPRCSGPSAVTRSPSRKEVNSLCTEI
jgi:nucleoside-diphosphate-sugar epimerase